MKISNLAISSALALGLGAGMVTNATADVHAVAVNEITNLTVVFTNPTQPDSAVFRVDRNADLGSIPGTDGGNVPFNSGTAPFDVTQAFQGSGAAPAENTFSAVGDLGYNYARSDSSILQSQLNPGQPPVPSGSTSTSSSSVAESYLSSNDNGFGDAGNSSITTVTFTSDGTQSISFRFDSDPYLLARVDADSAFASDASAEISLVFVISNAAGDPIFEWAPDGTIGDITGGTETLAPFALNDLITRDQDNTGVAITDNTNGTFAAVTNVLDADTYTLELRLRTTVNTQLTRADNPEPEMLGLLGLSMLGIGFARFLRRRKAA